MVTIISKQEGPSKAEAKLKHALQQNRGTIDGMAKALKHGPMAHLAPAAAPAAAPQPASTKTVSYRKTSSEGEARPYIRVSMNGRVVVVDFDTGNQLHHLGDVRGKREAAKFALATKANGFFAPLDEALRAALESLDGTAIPDAAAEEKFKTDVAVTLGLV